MNSIHQFHSGSAIGDAVTNSMFLIQDVLKKCGFFSEIYVEHVAEELSERIHSFKSYKPEADDHILIHHSMGHEQLEWIVSLPVKKILVYHNITPAEFFPPDSPFRHYSLVGREQLLSLKSEVCASIADSELNASELHSIGYQDVSVIPMLLDIEAFQATLPDPAILNTVDNSYTILFVGRISPNKCQHDLLDVLEHLRQMHSKNVRLVLVGGYDIEDAYYRELQDKILLAGLENNVLITGKVSDQELVAWYKVADIFLCMSEHEGFGVPLIEAMALDLPVVACKHGNIPYTMEGAGLVLKERNPVQIAALLKIISNNRIFKRSIVSYQQKRVEKMRRGRLVKSLCDFFVKQGITIPKPSRSILNRRSKSIKYQIEGPFETSYSLALVNRELAFALDRLVPTQVGLFATEGLGDYTPLPDDIAGIAGLSALSDRGRKRSGADVVIRNLYPPRVADMDGQVNILSIAWEESGFPCEYVTDFNDCLDGIAVVSVFVKKVLIDNGVFLPIKTISNGFDHIENVQVLSLGVELPKGYKFLHISSCFPRKGVDVLLAAFCNTYSSSDNVSLVIKTFPNIHNTVSEDVENLRKNQKDCPNICVIEEDLPVEQMVDLYKQCDAFVAPSRGEGFGLPMAEAMWYGLPVITTGYGGQVDFCKPNTSWLIDFSFQTAQSHLGLPDSTWVEPDVDHLGKLMQTVSLASLESLQPKLSAAKTLLQDLFTWDDCAKRLTLLEEKIVDTRQIFRKKIKLAWVSSWNTKCGIATYSKFLLDELSESDFDVTILSSYDENSVSADKANVVRCWKNKNDTIDLLKENIIQSDYDVLVIQFNYAFYSLPDLGDLIELAKVRNIVIVVMLHITQDLPPPFGPSSLKSIRKQLSKADRLLVHDISDLNRLKNMGMGHNTTLFPHGIHTMRGSAGTDVRGTYNISTKALVIGTFGFLLPHKGVKELIEAFSILKKQRSDAVLLLVNALYPEPSSSKVLRKECLDLIEEFGLRESVIMETDYLSDEESTALLGTADIAVFPYQETEESASGAVRYALALNIPVLVTPLKIFSDVSDIVYELPGSSATSIARGIDKFFAEELKVDSKREGRTAWIKNHDWPLLATRLGGMLKGLHVNSEC